MPPNNANSMATAYGSGRLAGRRQHPGSPGHHAGRWPDEKNAQFKVRWASGVPLSTPWPSNSMSAEGRSSTGPGVSGSPPGTPNLDGGADRASNHAVDEWRPAGADRSRARGECKRHHQHALEAQTAGPAGDRPPRSVGRPCRAERPRRCPAAALGKRREPPPARPPFVAHVCTDWTPEHVHNIRRLRARPRSGDGGMGHRSRRCRSVLGLDVGNDASDAAGWFLGGVDAGDPRNGGALIVSVGGRLVCNRRGGHGARLPSGWRRRRGTLAGHPKPLQSS